jgi:CO/xanthine dehydrogenase FAD-binding subunit
MYLAGGTILVPTGSPSLDFLVDLTRLGLDHIRLEDGALNIGATTRIADLVDNDALSRQEFRAIGEAARWIGTHTVRNRATVGGNIFAAHFPSDLPPVLLALGADIVLHGTGGTREVGLEDFYTRRSEVYSRGDLILEVRIPQQNGSVSAFEKTGRTRVDVAIVSCAASVTLKGGAIEAARIALGGLTALPVVASEAAAFLAGRAPTPDVFRDAGQLVLESVSPRSDHRAGGEYRRKVAGVLATRVLSRAAGSA